MKASACTVMLCALTLSTASLARAQDPVPDAGMLVPGVDVGLAFPTEDALETSATLGVSLDYYVTPRFSVRPSAQFASFQIGPESDLGLSSTRVGIDGVYNWERGAWHPFVGAGIAFHRQDIEEDDLELADGAELGATLLGGVEYFLNRNVTVKGELGYRPAGGLTGWPDPSSITTTVGVKWYP